MIGIITQRFLTGFFFLLYLVYIVVLILVIESRQVGKHRKVDRLCEVSEWRKEKEMVDEKKKKK